MSSSSWLADLPPHAAVAPMPVARTLAKTLDPYARWGHETQWRGFQRAAAWQHPSKAKGDEFFQIIACVKKGQAIPTCAELEVADIYRKYVPGTTSIARHFTARVQRKHLNWLLENKLGLRWELAIPLRDALSVARATRHGVYGEDREQTIKPPANVLADALTSVNQNDRPKGLGDTVAVIDFGCPFLNPRFANSAGSRIAALWDQGSSVPTFDMTNPVGVAKAAKWPWRSTAHFQYGRELNATAIQAMASAVAGPNGAIEETLAYRGIDYLVAYDDPRRRVWMATHGAHVLDMAGGTLDPLDNKDEATTDAAGKANLVFVQLPALTAADSAGGSLSAHLLDGLRYVLDVCSGKSKVVANISYGTFAGPHDGSSLIESAMDELLTIRKENFAIVLAAGNAKQAQSHVQRQVRPGHSALLRLMLAPGDTTDTFAEIWVAPHASAGALEARVRHPEHEWSDWVGAGQQALLRDNATKKTAAMLRYDTKVPNGKGALILLALSPTAAPDDVPTPLTMPGLWEIEVRLPQTTPADTVITIDGWLERDDPGESGGPESHWLGLGVEDSKSCLSSIATGKYTIAVGGFRLCDSAPTNYSSVGPQRDTQAITPLVYGACEEDPVQRGIRAAAVRSSEVFRMNGTSVAAPVVARRVFNWMVGQTAPAASTGWKKALSKVVALENAMDAKGNPLGTGAVKQPAN